MCTVAEPASPPQRSPDHCGASPNDDDQCEHGNRGDGGRLAEYFGDLASALVRSERRRAVEYNDARGLVEAGARKSLKPMVVRIGGTSVEYEARCTIFWLIVRGILR